MKSIQRNKKEEEGSNSEATRKTKNERKQEKTRKKDK